MTALKSSRTQASEGRVVLSENAKAQKPVGDITQCAEIARALADMILLTV